MISELDESIRRLLITQGGLDPAEIDIQFEIPDREWASSISRPTVNCYLYDIRENRQLRTGGWEHRRNGDGTGSAARRGPWRIDLSYLLTAWTKAVEDEHRLLWQVMATLFNFPIIPTELLQGALVETELPIPTSVAQPEGALRSPGEFWSALENKLKPALNYVVTLPLDPSAIRQAPLVRSPLQIRPPSYLGGAGATNGQPLTPASLTGNDAGFGIGTMPTDRPSATAHVVGVLRDADGKIIPSARIYFSGARPEGGSPLGQAAQEAPTEPPASSPRRAGGRRGRGDQAPPPVTGGGFGLGQAGQPNERQAASFSVWGGVHANRRRGSRNSVLDCDGKFLFPALPFGRYSVIIEIPGRPLIEREIVVPSESYDFDLSELTGRPGDAR